MADAADFAADLMELQTALAIKAARQTEGTSAMQPDDMKPIDEAVMWLLGAFLAICCIHGSYLLSQAVAARDTHSQIGVKQCS